MRRFAPGRYNLLNKASTVAWASTKTSASTWNFAKCEQFVQLKHDPDMFGKLSPGKLSVGEEMFLACPAINSGVTDQEILDMKAASAEKVLKDAFPTFFSHLTFEKPSAAAPPSVKLHGVDYSKVPRKQRQGGRSKQAC